MARSGRSLMDLAAEIERRAEAKKDFVAPASKLSLEVIDAPELGAKPYPAITLQGKAEAFPLQEVAHGQLAEYTGIPMAYYRRMLGASPDLLAANVNRWLSDLDRDTKARRMVRTLDGSARALLSDCYRTLENEDLAEAVLPVLLEQNLMIVSCEITDRRLYIKAVDRAIERDVPSGRKMGDGSHAFFDTVSPGIVISNSEVGYGRLNVETAVYTRVCTNLAMMGSAFRKHHAGKRAELSEEVMHLLTDETKKATDRAVFMQVRDVVKAAFDLAKFDATIKRLGEATQDVIPAEQAIDVVERVGKRFSWNDGERKGILARLIEGGDLSRYGLHSAVTRHSQEEVIAYDRATELERVGGEIIELAGPEWQRMVAVA